MRGAYGIIGLVGIFLLLLGAAGAYAYTNNGMMGNKQGAYKGMMNNNGDYGGMMGDLDKNSRDQMSSIYDQMMENIDPETAKQMDAMHDACMENDDGDE